MCVPKSHSDDRYAITCDVIAYHSVHSVSIRLINKCQLGIDFIFTRERAIYSSFMKISVHSPVIFEEKHFDESETLKKYQKAFSKFYHRHSELIVKYNIGLKTLLQQGISEPIFYGDLVYKFKLENIILVINSKR